MKYQGSCHCGQVAFEVEGELTGVMSCNCSMCQRKGTLMWFVPRAALALLTPPENMATYTFNKHVIQHRFCKHCGIQSFAWGKDPRGNEMAAINLRCLEDFEFESIPVKQVNGKVF